MKEKKEETLRVCRKVRSVSASSPFLSQLIAEYTTVAWPYCMCFSNLYTEFPINVYGCGSVFSGTMLESMQAYVRLPILSTKPYTVKTATFCACNNFHKFQCSVWAFSPLKLLSELIDGCNFSQVSKQKARLGGETRKCNRNMLCRSILRKVDLNRGIYCS